MENFKFILIGIAAGIIGIICFYFFYFVPQVNDAFERGKKECQSQTDSVFIPGDTVYKWKDTSFSHQQPVQIDTSDSTINYSTKFDSSFASHKDSIYFAASVQISKGPENGFKSIWDVRIKHRDFQQLPDTIKKYIPKYIKETEIKNNWMITFIAYIGGILSAIAFLIFIPKG